MNLCVINNYLREAKPYPFFMFLMKIPKDTVLATRAAGPDAGSSVEVLSPLDFLVVESRHQLVHQGLYNGIGPAQRHTKGF